MKQSSRWSGLVYLLPLLVFLPFLNQFVYLRGSAYSDLTISHLPNLYYLHRALVEYHTIPLWSPAILSGFPFFANPLSGLWYPPGWLAVIWPAAWAFNLLAALHLVFGAVGMGALLGKLGLGREGRWIGALAFGLMPKLLAHYAAGHITLLYAVVWTPWLLWAALRPGGHWVRPGLLLAVIFFADPRWAAYAGVLWLAWSAAYSRISGESPEAWSKWAWLWSAGKEVLLAGLLAAPLLIPLLEYSALSTRNAMSPQDALAFSLHVPESLVYLFFPVAGVVEWTFYPGVVVLVGALAAAIMPGVRKKSAFWFWVALGSLLFAFGDQIPGLWLWTKLPIAGLLRVPARSLFLFDIALIMLAAHAYDEMLNRALRGWRRFAFLAGLLLAVTWWIGVAIIGLRALDPVMTGLLWAGVCIAGFAAAAVSFIPRIPLAWRTAVLIVFCFLDLCLAARLMTVPIAVAEVNSQGAQAAAWLAAQPGRFRVYSPSYSVPQHTAARYGLELADGIDPLQLQAYADFMGQAGGIPQTGYSVTLPPLKGDIQTVNRDALPEPALLGLINVRFVAAEFDLDIAGLQKVVQFGSTRVYENLLNGGAQISAAVVFSPDFMDWTPNRISIALPGPADIALTEIAYPGWVVEGGGLLSPFTGTLRTVSVPKGAAGVVVVFRPLSLYAGLLLFFAGCVWMVWRKARG